jgi:hypothetical protein
LVLVRGVQLSPLIISWLAVVAAVGPIITSVAVVAAVGTSYRVHLLQKYKLTQLSLAAAAQQVRD